MEIRYLSDHSLWRLTNPPTRELTTIMSLRRQGKAKQSRARRSPPPGAIPKFHHLAKQIRNPVHQSTFPSLLPLPGSYKSRPTFSVPLPIRTLGPLSTPTLFPQPQPLHLHSECRLVACIFVQRRDRPGRPCCRWT